MKRKIYTELLEWKNKKNKKPLIILGARQVGKTYIITKFCNEEYKNVLILNLLEKPEIVDLYKERIDSEEKLRMLKAIIGSKFDIENEDTIIFFDEIQESEELISNLKFFNEKHPNLNIICAGSLLGVKLKRTRASFPVGKVEMINMYPLNFEEFLLAFKEDLLIDEIRRSFNNNTELIKSLHNKALLFYHYYLCVGGMPNSVVSLVNSDRDFTKYDSLILKNIVSAYFNDMNKYVMNKNESLKIENLYNSVPGQLSNESNKFQYTKIDGKGRKRDYETALDWLLASRLLLESKKVSLPEVPLKGFVQNNFFKLFMSDVGILREILDLKFADILTDNISLYKGAIVENYVATEFVSNDIELFYWASKGTAKIDFLLYTKDGIIPVEAKAKVSTKSKSLNSYIKKYNPKYSIRISQKNFGFINGIKSIPLYAIFCIDKNM